MVQFFSSDPSRQSSSPSHCQRFEMQRPFSHVKWSGLHVLKAVKCQRKHSHYTSRVDIFKLFSTHVCSPLKKSEIGFTTAKNNIKNILELENSSYKIFENFSNYTSIFFLFNLNLSISNKSEIRLQKIQNFISRYFWRVSTFPPRIRYCFSIFPQSLIQRLLYNDLLDSFYISYSFLIRGTSRFFWMYFRNPSFRSMIT